MNLPKDNISIADDILISYTVKNLTIDRGKLFFAAKAYQIELKLTQMALNMALSQRDFQIIDNIFEADLANFVIKKYNQELDKILKGEM